MLKVAALGRLRSAAAEGGVAVSVPRLLLWGSDILTPFLKLGHSIVMCSHG